MGGKKEEFLKICPKCGSIDVGPDYSNPIVWADGLTVKFRCNSCQYLSNFFPEVSPSNVKKYIKELKKGKAHGIVSRTKPQMIDTVSGYYAAFIFYSGFVFMIGIIAFMISIFSNLSFRVKTVFFVISLCLFFLGHSFYNELFKKRL